MFGIGKALKRRNALIRELAEWRMTNSGFDSIEYRLKTRELSIAKLLGMPEGTLVAIMEMAIISVNNGMTLAQSLQKIENGRKLSGHNPYEFSQIMSIALEPDTTAGRALPLYCKYRIDLEHGVLTEGQFMHEYQTALEVILSWQ